MIPSRNVISPLLVFLALLVVFELCVRLPYVIYAMDAPELGTDAIVHFFGLNTPSRVIWLGLSIVILATLATFLAFGILGSFHRMPLSRPDFERVGWLIYPIGLMFLGVVVASVLSLGVEALAEDISGKRSEFGDRGMAWVMMRFAVFSHMIGAIFYIRMVQTGRMFDKAAFAISVLMVAVPAIVFSLRATIISFTLEILYLQLLFGTFQFRRFLRLAAVMLPALIAISALRPDAEFRSTFEAAMFGIEKAVQSRYFFDFAKIGTVMSWAETQPWVGPIVFGFVLEPFLGDQIIFYKEIGPMIAEQVYLYRGLTGVTPGFLLESTLSFGVPLGILLFVVVMSLFLMIERRMLETRSPSLAGLLFRLLLVSKVSLLLNSSLGAFAFQLIVEGVMLFAVLGFLSLASGGLPNRLGAAIR